MLLKILKGSFLFQNFASWLFSRLSPMIEHNIGKYMALKKCFYLTALERLDGDYLEFGVFTGSSFVFANRIHKKLRTLGPVKTRFFGFDSFSGFGDVSAHDRHPFYIDSIFSVNADKVVRNIRRKSAGNEVQIVKGYFENTLAGKTARDMGIEKTRIIFIDCDLKDPAALALEFAKPTIQTGTILLMDDFFSYKGDPSLGVAGAFNDFQKKYANITWRHVLFYGYGGAGYIATVS